MSAFEFVFSLFSLLLGLALATGLSGLAKALKVRHTIRIGWLTALLGLFVSLDLVTFWAYAWALKDVVPPSFPVLFYGFIATSLYFVAASCIFPDEPDEWADLDAYFFRQRRIVLGGTFIANAMLLGAVIFMLGASDRWLSPRTLLITWSLFPLTLVAMLAKRRAVIVGALAWLILLYPASIIWR